jgi:hypothetical protein
VVVTSNASTGSVLFDLPGELLKIGSGNIQSKAVAVAALADGTDGELITWSASAVAATVAVGTATHVLTSNGAGSAPTFQAAGGGGPSQANQAALEAETDQDTYAAPDLLRYSPGAAKFWIKAGYDGSVLASYNVTSVTDVGTGLLTIVIATDFTDASWVVTACTETPYTRSTNVDVPSGSGQLAGSVAMRVTDNNGTLSDGTYLHVAGWGTQV